jgi:hypothetical protein
MVIGGERKKHLLTDPFAQIGSFIPVVNIRRRRRRKKENSTKGVRKFQKFLLETRGFSPSHLIYRLLLFWVLT